MEDEETESDPEQCPTFDSNNDDDGNDKPRMWPKFVKNDEKINFFYENEDENIFNDFKPSIEKHVIRNKKRKPKKHEHVLRLVSESEIHKKKKNVCDNCNRCVLITVLVICILVILAISVTVGVYYGVYWKSHGETEKSSSLVDAVTHSPTSSADHSSAAAEKPITPSTTQTATLGTSSTSYSLTTTLKPTTSTLSTTTTTNTTTTSTSTIPTTTTTTKTTSTIPKSTKSLIGIFSNTSEDIEKVINRTKVCQKEIIPTTTDGPTTEVNCSLYVEMMRCAYFHIIKDAMYLSVETLAEQVESHAIFPSLIEIDPNLCKDNGHLSLHNVTVLPTTPSEICASIDAVIYFGRYDCKLVHALTNITTYPEEDKCRLMKVSLECVAQTTACDYNVISDFFSKNINLVLGQLKLSSFNATLCGTSQ